MAKKPTDPGEAAPAQARLGTSIPDDVPKRGSTAFLRLTQAYQAVFSGHGTREDADIVKSDLAVYTGFFMVSPKGSPNDVLQFQEGLRSAYAHIFNFLNLTGAEAGRLQEAARAEALDTNQEGDFT